MFDPWSPSKSNPSAKPSIQTLVKIPWVPALKRIASFAVPEPKPIIVTLIKVGLDQNPPLFATSVL